MTVAGPDPHLGDSLSALIDGELSLADQADAIEHLRVCPTCSQEMVAVSQARAWVRDLPRVEPPEQVMARPPAPRPARRAPLPARRRRMGIGVAMASAAASVAVAALAAPRQAPAAPALDRLIQVHAAASSVADDPVSQLVPAGVPVTFAP